MPHESDRCRLEVAYGSNSSLYSFPNGHPLSSNRVKEFGISLEKIAQANKDSISIVEPVPASEEDLLLFHTKEYVEFVKDSSKTGVGFLDYGDTPSFKGVYEASLYPVGSSLDGLRRIVEGKIDHFFNPVGGLHHARRDRAGGFCVFNDCAVAISTAINRLGMKRVAYVDIDAHHGDGVFYGFESDARVIVGDIHESGKYLYPGTGSASETGTDGAKNTKMNVPLNPGSGFEDFGKVFDKVETFVRGFSPEFIFFQCGADGLEGDPLAHLAYTPQVHSFASKRLHSLAHEKCGGRILAMGGGGYNPRNVNLAWTCVTLELGNQCK